MSDEIIETTCYLTVGATDLRRWPKLTLPRITKHKPNVSGSEVSIMLNIRLPKTLFTRPQIEANIQVPEDSVIPPVVSMEVIDNIQEIAATQGLELVIHAPDRD
jgi:hypothetical protein